MATFLLRLLDLDVNTCSFFFFFLLFSMLGFQFNNISRITECKTKEKTTSVPVVNSGLSRRSLD